VAGKQEFGENEYLLTLINFAYHATYFHVQAMEVNRLRLKQNA
jgi:hypothetical protein